MEIDVYAGCGDIAGPLRAPVGASVRFRPVLDGRPRQTLRGLVAANVVAETVFVGWLVAPPHWRSTFAAGGAAAVAALAGILLVELLRLSQAASLWVFSLNARDPVPVPPPAGLCVAFVTTIVPSREPIELVRRTLTAMRRVRYGGGSVDVWILDEGDDPRVRAAARRLGVRHFSRHGRPELNTPSGRFRARTKAGNHNAWRAAHGGDYDVVAQLDPDHVPRPNLLERTLGYFRDPDVAFVVAPQVYGDSHTAAVRHGAAAQAYFFHGVVQRGGNGLGAPLLIGTNHVYRTAALAGIDGYQDSVIEDHLTSMTLHATRNPRTGRGWKGVYTPDVLAVGRAPATWGDFFSQQRRWAYGVAEIVLRHAHRLRPGLSRRQQVVYALLQSFYPSVALTWVVGTAVTVSYLLHAAAAPRLQPAVWTLLWSVSVATTLVPLLWLRRLNLAPHERRELGAAAVLATLGCGPVYVAACASALLRRGTAYRVTPKGSAARPDSLGAFGRHLGWSSVVAAALGLSLAGGPGAAVPRFWALVTIAASGTPPALHLTGLLRRARPLASGHPRRRSPRVSPIPGAGRRTRRPRRASRRRPLLPDPPAAGRAAAARRSSPGSGRRL